MPQRVGIVGAGLVGLAVALKLHECAPKLAITVWDKEPAPGAHQSTHNSGVLHAGLYYKPGSLKARLAVQGIREMTRFCREHGIKHEICGKVVVATDAAEAARLEKLFQNGTANGLAGLRKISAEEIREIEPFVQGTAALHVPEEGIVDFKAVVQTMKRLAEERGITVALASPVRSLALRGEGWIVTAGQEEHKCDFLINCAGLHCDRIATLAGERPKSRIVPFRGEYYLLRESARHLVRNLVYPVPDPVFPFLGVHFSRLIGGGLEAGPNAVLALAREGYAKRSFNLRDALDAATFPGLWKFLMKHRGMCVQESLRSFSKGLFCRSLQRLVPALQPEDLESGGAGVRAQAMTEGGMLVQDFDFIERPSALHVLNAPSPGATASLAIGQHIANAVCGIMALQTPARAIASSH